MMQNSPPHPHTTPRGVHPRERGIFLVIGDFIGALIALLATLFIWANWTSEWLEFSLNFLVTRPPLWFYFLPFIWLFLIVDTYNIYTIGNIRATISATLLSAFIGFMLYTMVYFFPSEPGSLPRLGVPIFLMFASLATISWHGMYARLFANPALMRRVLVIGAGRAGESLFKMMDELSQPPFVIVGVLDDDSAKHDTEFHGHVVHGGAELLMDRVIKDHVTDIVVAVSGSIAPPLFRMLIKAQEVGIEITRMQTIYEELLARVPIFHQEADWIVRSFVEQSRPSTFFEIMKRLIDVVGGLFGIVVILMIFPFIAIANLLESGFPVFYTQRRSGRFDQPYDLVKFRTMIQDAEREDQKHYWTIEGDQRITRVGRFLRKTHLDELPQLINVVRGEMSLVGPRPERPELVEYYQERVPFYRARLLVKPGITGWAQIHQKYAASVEETNIKLEYDLYYIKHRGFLLDMIILLRTPATVLGLRGR